MPGIIAEANNSGTIEGPLLLYPYPISKPAMVSVWYIPVRATSCLRIDIDSTVGYRYRISMSVISSSLETTDERKKSSDKYRCDYINSVNGVRSSAGCRYS